MLFGHFSMLNIKNHISYVFIQILIDQFQKIPLLHHVAFIFSARCIIGNLLLKPISFMFLALKMLASSTFFSQ